jgi:hypothetical protein
MTKFAGVAALSRLSTSPACVPVVRVTATEAKTEATPVDYYPSVGVGVRVLIPQLGTQIRAFDLAFPLRDALGAPAGRPVFSYGLEQSF